MWQYHFITTKHCVSKYKLLKKNSLQSFIKYVFHQLNPLTDENTTNFYLMYFSFDSIPFVRVETIPTFNDFKIQWNFLNSLH